MKSAPSAVFADSYENVAVDKRDFQVCWFVIQSNVMLTIAVYAYCISELIVNLRWTGASPIARRLQDPMRTLLLVPFRTSA